MKVPILFRDMTSLIRWPTSKKTVSCIFPYILCYSSLKYTGLYIIGCGEI